VAVRWLQEIGASKVRIVGKPVKYELKDVEPGRVT
jgi:hypothetical protein